MHKYVGGEEGGKRVVGREGNAESEARDVGSSTPEGTKKEWLEWEEGNQGSKRHPEI